KRRSRSGIRRSGYRGTKIAEPRVRSCGMARVTHAIPRLVVLGAVLMGLSCEIMRSEPHASVSPLMLPSAPTSASADSSHLPNPADQRTIEQALARDGVRV